MENKVWFVFFMEHGEIELDTCHNSNLYLAMISLYYMKNVFTF